MKNLKGIQKAMFMMALIGFGASSCGINKASSTKGENTVQLESQDIAKHEPTDTMVSFDPTTLTEEVWVNYNDSLDANGEILKTLLIRTQVVKDTIIMFDTKTKAEELKVVTRKDTLYIK